MKYKVGDKVKIKENLIIGNMYGGLYLYGGATRHIGEETIVTKVEKERYRLAVDNSSRIWTYEMLEPVEEMSAEEAIKLSGEMCSSSDCYECPVFKSREKYSEMCNVFRKEHAEEYLEILKQWKADHEKKPIETKSVYIIRVIENTDGMEKCVYKEKKKDSEGSQEAMERVLKEYCKTHEGRFFTVAEWTCQVKE